MKSCAELCHTAVAGEHERPAVQAEARLQDPMLWHKAWRIRVRFGREFHSQGASVIAPLLRSAVQAAVQSDTLTTILKQPDSALDLLRAAGRCGGLETKFAKYICQNLYQQPAPV